MAHEFGGRHELYEINYDAATACSARRPPATPTAAMRGAKGP
jgi:hypothetical protein